MTRPLRITVGVDSEPASRLAVDWAIREASRHPSQLTLLTAFDLLMADPFDGEQILERERARVLGAAPGVPVETALVEGSIPETLKRYATSSDLLVIGSHRTRHWRSVLSGNLPVAMASRSSCPIVIVPDDWEPRAGFVAVGFDSDASSDAALRRAGEFARVGGGELRVLHAWTRPEPPTDPVGLYLRVPKDLQRPHRRRLETARRRTARRFPGLKVQEHLYEGSAFTGLLHLGERAELIVIGSHRRGPLAGIVLGSVARQLLRHSKTPVCVVPPSREVARSAPTRPEEAWA